MKRIFFLCAFCLFAFVGFAQDHVSDTTAITVSGFDGFKKNQPVVSEDLYVKGQLDASRNYKKYKGASTGTLITSLVSPIIGLIPAIACSATAPKLEKLGYPDEKLFMQKEYYNGYTKKAKKIKSGKVWKSWGIGLGVNLLLAIVIASS